MSLRRRVSASLVSVRPFRGDRQGESEVGLRLRFQPLRSRTVLEPIDDFASLGPDYCIPSVAGLGKVLRILRAARIAPPADAADLLGREAETALLLQRALGAEMVLELRARSTVRFTVWTMDGVESVDGVSEVVEGPEAFTIFRSGGRLPMRIDRDRVVRQQTESRRWYEVVAID